MKVFLQVTVCVLVLSTSLADDVPCPRGCRSCVNGVAECSKRSITAPPRIYPRGTMTINLNGNHILVIAEKSFDDHQDTVEVLTISGNKIGSLRNDAFRAFPNLNTLDLSNNRISKITKQVFKDLNKLRTLSLNRNKIDSVEGILQYVPNLRELNVANNRIVTIGQNDLGALSGVHYLDLRDNLISSIHSQAFKDMNNLRYLFLNSNPLVTTPRFEFGSEVLQVVDLSQCDMRTVPGPFPPSVTDLRLGHNKIIQVEHQDLLNITDLQLLTLNNNELHYLADGSLSHLTHLKEVWLRENKLVYIPRSIPDSVLKVHMDSNNIQQIETGLFTNMSHLDYLTVENNQIVGIQPNTFRGLRFLKTLNFQGNLIYTLEKDTFTDLDSLNTILLSSNPLRNIELGAFRNLSNLRKLYMGHIGEDQFELEGNFLQEMLRLEILHLKNSPGLVDKLMAVINDSTRFSIPLEKLTQLDLSFNNLKWISPRVRVVFPNLLSMPLDGNPLRCSQSLKWLRDWMVSSEVTFHNISEITCETPMRLKNRPIRSIEDNEWAADNEVDDGNVVVPTLNKDLDMSEPGGIIQQDDSATRAKPVKQEDGGSKKSKDGKEQKKPKGKSGNGKKIEKKSKGEKKGKDKSNKGKKKQ